MSSRTLIRIYHFLGRIGNHISGAILPQLKVMLLWDSIQNFKHLNGEPLYKSWQHFKKMVLQCLALGLCDKVLLQYFYHCMNSVNKGVADQLQHGGLMQQPYAVATQLLCRLSTEHGIPMKTKYLLTPLRYLRVKFKSIMRDIKTWPKK